MKRKLLNGKIRKITATLLAVTLATGTMGALSGCQLSENSSDTSKSEDSSTKNSSDNSEDVKEINIGISSTSSKNHYFEDDGTETGFEYELIKELDDALPQYKFNIVTEEFSSLFVSLDSGTVDAVFGNLRRSEERDEGYIHTYRAYNYSPYRVLVEENNTTINSIDDLNGKKLGLSQGSLQALILEEYQKEHNISIEYVYTKDYTNDLVSGKIDAFIAPEFDLEKYNTSFDDIKFKIVGDVVAGESGPTADSNTYVYLAKGSKQLRDDLSDAIYELRESGKLSELSTKFYGEDYTARIETDHEEELMKEAGK